MPPTMILVRTKSIDVIFDLKLAPNMLSTCCDTKIIIAKQTKYYPLLGDTSKDVKIESATTKSSKCQKLISAKRIIRQMRIM